MCSIELVIVATDPAVVGPQPPLHVPLFPIASRIRNAEANLVYQAVNALQHWPILVHPLYLSQPDLVRAGTHVQDLQHSESGEATKTRVERKGQALSLERALRVKTQSRFVRQYPLRRGLFALGAMTDKKLSQLCQGCELIV